MQRHWLLMQTDPAAGGGGEEIPSAPEIPEFVAEKFRSAADPVRAQAESYAEAEREMNRLRADNERKDRDFAEALSRIESAPAPQAPYNPSLDPTIAAYQSALDSGDAAAALAIQLQLTQGLMAQQLDQRFGQLEERFQTSSDADRDYALRLAEQQVAPAYGERWSSDLAPRLTERLQSRPDLLPQAASVEGYAAVLREQANVLEAERIVGEQRAAESDRQAKLAAQTLDNSTARIPIDTDAKKQEWQAIKGAGERSWNELVG